MKHIYLLFLTIFTLSACASDFSNELHKDLKKQNSQKSANLARNNAVWEQRKSYIISGMRYDVGVSPDRSYALVSPVGQETFSLGEVETAARAATGCLAKGDSFLYLLGANQGSRIPVSALKNISGRTRVELDC